MISVLNLETLQIKKINVTQNKIDDCCLPRALTRVMLTPIDLWFVTVLGRNQIVPPLWKNQRAVDI